MSKPKAESGDTGMGEVQQPTLLSDLLQLAKPRLTMLVVLTASLGVATSWAFPETWNSRFTGTTTAWLERWTVLIALSLGTALLAAAANSLNMLWERKQDQLMQRTAVRATAKGRIGAAVVLPYATLLASSGTALLWWQGNPLTAALGFVSLILYVLVYTPLKKRTPLNTILGAIPGALPPLIGWCGAGGSPWHPVGLALFGILFIWQIPHFLAIAWMHREEYEKAGFKMLPSVDPEGHRTARISVIWSLLLWGVSLSPTLTGHAGLLYLAVANLGGFLMTLRSYQLALHRDKPAARKLFFASLIYLPPVLSALVISSGS
ncbi:MAG: protoheme IX farnesyltransferase [Planctomycetes bacterium]|nr:protoheme IX farnesyltransferase [Planctomycetota bacterium]